MTKRLLLSIIILMTCAMSSIADSNTSRIDKSLTIYADVLRQLDINYVDTLNCDQLLNTSINAMLQQVDPYTVYIPKSEDATLRMLTQGKYGGIGSIIMQRDSDIYISDPYQHMPAEQAGLMAGDKIVSVDGMLCHGLTTQDVSNKLRGNSGTTIKIVVERNGELITRNITRKDINLPAVSYADVLQDTIAYIAFDDFTSNSAQVLLTHLDKLTQKATIKHLIIDIRGNGGGIIDEAVQLLSFFLPKGTEVVSTQGKTDRVSHIYATTTSPIFPQLPLTVMVDRNSASASEIVAGALQDLKRATIVGERTFGKGLVQNIRPIAYDGHLKITTSKYYLPSGRCIQAIDYAERQKGNKLHKDTTGGILPDVILTDSQKLDITYQLYTQHMFFDYATQYRLTHNTIPPAKDFYLTDQDLQDFCTFLQERNFVYETETAKYIKDIIKMAKKEDIEQNIVDELNTLLEHISSDYQQAIFRNKDEVIALLGAEIVKRYYYQEGYAAYNLRYDKDLQKTLKHINQ